MKRFILISCALTLFGCASPRPSLATENSQSETFQLHTATDGRVYRIETRTGKTHWLDGSTFRAVSEQTMPQLEIGKVYRGEDGTSTYRYEGVGKLEKWGLDKYNTQPQINTPTQR